MPEEPIKIPEDGSLEDFMDSDEFKTIKEKYKDVFDSVTSRESLSQGYVSMTRTITGFGDITLRTLTKRERDFITIKAPLVQPLTPDQYSANLIKRDELILLFGIVSIPNLGFDIGNSYVSVPNNLSEWDNYSNQPLVTAKRDFINNLSEYAEEMLLTLINELRSTARLAMAEQLKNQNTPRTV